MNRDDWLKQSDRDSHDPGLLIARRGSWVHLRSSNVESIRYLMKVGELRVRFLDHGYGASDYAYYNVPVNVFLDFMVASSPGRFVWRVLRGGAYEYRKLS